MHIAAVRSFADVARGKWRSKLPKFLILLAHNSILLCLLKFSLRGFVTNNLSEVRQCQI